MAQVAYSVGQLDASVSQAVDARPGAQVAVDERLHDIDHGDVRLQHGIGLFPIDVPALELELGDAATGVVGVLVVRPTATSRTVADEGCSREVHG